MIYRKIIYVVLFSIFLASCGLRSGNKGQVATDSVTFRYASLLHIYNYNGCRQVVIDNPWRSGQSLHKYVLVPKSCALPRKLPEGTLIRIPMQHMVVGASVHCALFRDLGAMQNVKGVCDLQYILSPFFHEAVKTGKIQDMGSSLNVNVEKVLSAKCDGILLSPYDRGSYGAVEKTKIPIVECADYMETSPLGRAEWMRFYGMLVGREKMADSIFASVEDDYRRLCKEMKNIKKHPTIFTDLLLSGTWYQPGGKSTMGILFADAGGRYLFGDNHHSGSINLSFESVFYKAHDADIWLIKYGAAKDLSYDALAKEKISYTRFRAFKKQQIWGCNLFHVPFFEEGVFHPNIILRDLIQIFHPGVLKNSNPVFFTRLK